MFLVTRCARRGTRYVTGNGSLAFYKATVNRAHRHNVNLELKALASNPERWDDEENLFQPKALVTGWEIC